MGSLELKSLNLKYGDCQVLDNMNVSIENGESFAFVGPSGCGKTTLLKVISGLAYPDSGQVLYNREAVHDFSKTKMLEYHEKSGFVFQNAALVGNMSIYENLSLYYIYHTTMKEEEIRHKIQELVDLFKFTDDLKNRPSSLSTGEKMVVSIMRAIAHDPEIVFWDEPLVNLDNNTTRKVKGVMTDLKKKGVTQILATYDGRLAMTQADRIAVMDLGRIIYIGTPQELENSQDEDIRHILNLE